MVSRVLQCELWLEFGLSLHHFSFGDKVSIEYINSNRICTLILITIGEGILWSSKDSKWVDYRTHRIFREKNKMSSRIFIFIQNLTSNSIKVIYLSVTLAHQLCSAIFVRQVHPGDEDESVTGKK